MSNPDLPPDQEPPHSPDAEVHNDLPDPMGLFQHSLSIPKIKELGVTPLARHLDFTEEQTNGHWCSRCQGIWFGYTLETECPVCGNRRG